MADFRKYANEQLVLELLTVVDNLGLALKHSAEAGEASQGLQQGVELVYKQLRDTLEKFGVKQFAAAGEPFDPAKHDAMMQVPTDEVPGEHRGAGLPGGVPLPRQGASPRKGERVEETAAGTGGSGTGRVKSGLVHEAAGT